MNCSFSARSECNHLVASMPISSMRAIIQSLYEVHIPNIHQGPGVPILMCPNFPNLNHSQTPLCYKFVLVYIKLTHLIFHALNRIIIMRCDNTSTSYSSTIPEYN